MEIMAYDDFKKLDLRVAKVLEAIRVEGSDKLVKLQVDMGSLSSEASSGRLSNLRQIIAGIGTVYAPETLVGKQIVVVANLEPRKLMGHESQGMLLAANDETGPVLIVPESEVVSGTLIK